ncbi:hypothetical protein D4764_16G0002150 [Takifugu flavidus]|uniref:Uncharacterized protein n=1 Tax=Takifugu flavidus TaxID=433684 RepID=A0A5C6NXZ8_9TELE|nr:hypothetical protein D4764_16G0002150 [Takifugu flavidus]
MSECVMEEEESEKSVVSSCVSMKSDMSKDEPINFGIGPQGSPLNLITISDVSSGWTRTEQSPQCPAWVSLKSDHSKHGLITSEVQTK